MWCPTLYKLYILGYEGWKEMVQEAVKDDTNLQKELVLHVSTYGDISEALMWAHFYNVPKEYWPHSVRLLNDNPNNDRHQQANLQIESEDSWDNDEIPQVASYHKLNLSPDHIILVDAITEFERFLDNMQDVYLVGVDCEWKPTFGVQKSELALMQIATRNYVYILDVIQLSGKAPHLWQELGNFLFNNCDILKLGFAFTSDTSIIIHSLPHLSFNQNAGFLDVLSLWKQIEKNPNIKLPYEVQSGGPSLSTLVHLCLGRPLDKSDQFSNWEKRPLRQSQLEYAALDAYCLIQVYDVLKSCSETVGFPFDDTCYNLMSTTKFKKKKSKTLSKSKSKDVIKVNPQPPSPHYEPVPADKISFVCDTMLQGLGKSLRRCGIDSAILENNADHKECVRHYQDERRYILTRGQIFNMLMGYVPAGHCFNVQSDDIDEQLKLVLDYFNINVTKDHVFSRCQGCNSNSFIKLAKSTMNALAIESRKTRQIEMYDTELVDEATGFSSEEDFEDDYARPPVSYTRKWAVCTEEKIDLGLSMTRNGAKIQVDSVPTGVLEKYDIFYVCEDCGKVYWDGSHFERVLANRLQGIIL
ncbi:5' exonuclease domain-containing protein [Holotrichia oblita]|uniref:5' exonuclease domain-containing protein n=1 Tax=Holotrichia oblita TaxID=644536 RepID=A0ACB9TVJ3_HOLOL|nr:5' exonuclease domain-containing protein [Holotrichia oblita]